MQTEKAVAFKLSPQQRLRWRLAMRGGYRRHVRGTAVIDGVLDSRRLQDAIGAVTARYEILRTRFTDRSGVPLQIITAGEDFSWSEFASRCDNERADGDARSPGAELQRSPAFAAQLSAGPHSHRLTLEVATACADGVSLELLFREIADSYAGFQPAGIALQYADIATWLNEMVAAAGEGAQFWRQALDGVADDVALPTERTPGEESPPRFRVARRIIHDGACAAAGIARTVHVSSTSVLLACWEALLWRLTDATRLLVGVTLAGRSYPGIDSAIGPLERQLPLVHDIDASHTVASLLSGLHERLDRTASWQEYFSWEMTEHSGLGSTHFGFAHHQLASAWSSGSLQWQIESLECAVQPNAVMLWCASSPHGLTCELSYDESRLSEAAAVTLLRQFETVLHEFARRPVATRLADLELVSDEERAVLASFNHTVHAVDPACTVVSMFHQQVQRRPDQIAVSGEHDATYAELETRANRLANQLIAAGAGPEHVVGVYLDRSISLIVSFLAIWKAGAAYLPLHDLPEMRLRDLCRGSGARLAVTDQKYASRLSAAGFDILDVDSPEIAVQSCTRPASRCSAGNLAYVMYTSGSTGEPKGVLVEHRSLANYMLWVLRQYGLGEGERVLMKTSTGFDASIREWLMPLLQGGTLILLREGLQRDPQALIRELHESRATTLHVVPTLLRVLVEEPQFRECRDLLRVFVGGELLDSALVKRFLESTGKTLINMYGPTETTVSATSLVVGLHENGAIGRPVANTQVHVLRADLSEAAIGEAGEICIGGMAVARGYIGRADDTAEKYVPDPYRAPATGGGRLYRTGDRGRYQPDGLLQFLGRRDGQVKVRGHRVELNEIERAVQTQRDVLHVAVLLKERTSGDRHLVAYVQLSPTAGSASLAEIDAGVRERLPEYMCPSQYVRLDAFARTHSGKLDRVALAALETTTTHNDSVAPRSDVEARLAHIWSAVLGVANVGVTDNFFQIGGDSIIAIQITARARQAGFQFTPLHLFQYQTIEELAKAAQPTGPSIEAAAVSLGEPFPLTPIQQAHFERPTDNIHHFNQGLLLAVPGHLQLPLLERALLTVYGHHDALHLRFEHTSTGWQQSYARGEPQIVRRDLSHSADPVAAMRTAIAAENASLHVSVGPLVRIMFFQLGGDHGDRLLLVAHHLVIDTVSWRILLDDLSECYTQLERGVEPHLPLRTASYRSWSEGLRDHVRTQDLREELAYWRKVHGRATESLLPDNPAGANTVALERVHVAKLQESETCALLSDAARPYKTQLMELFLSALSDALYRWRRHTAIEVMLEGHGREEILPGVDLTRTVGWFTSLYPVVLESRDHESTADRIKRTKEQLRAVPRRGVGYGLLRYLAEDSGLSRSGSVLVNYLGQLDGAIGRAALLPAAVEAGADSASPGRDRGYDLTLNALVHGGRLQMCWTYSAARFEDETIVALAQHLQESLRDLITHCCSPQAGGFTLSDVTDFGWGASQLDAVASAISRAEQNHAS